MYFVHSPKALILLCMARVSPHRSFTHHADTRDDVEGRSGSAPRWRPGGWRGVCRATGDPSVAVLGSSGAAAPDRHSLPPDSCSRHFPRRDEHRARPSNRAIVSSTFYEPKYCVFSFFFSCMVKCVSE
jgi:hypothetical protein